MISSLGREELYFRHQLSHQQIDDLLGESKAIDFPGSKAQYLVRLNAFREVTALFERASVPFMPQKGPVLSFRLYGDPIYRAYNDLDFLIPQAEIRRAAELLGDNGFVSPYYRLPGDECRLKMLFRHTSELFLRSQRPGTGIELHWSMFNARVASPADHDRLVEENRTEITFDGKRYAVLNGEAELLFLVIHGGLHAWSKLKWLVDIAVFLERCPVDQGKFLELTAQLHAQRLVGVCNELIRYWLPGTKLLPSVEKAPASMVRFAMKQSCRSQQNKNKGEFLSFFRNYWNAFPGLRYKFDLLGRNLFATDLASARWMPCSSVAFYIVSPFWKLRRGLR